MALNIDWPTGVITIPQADLTSLGGGVYELDLDTFRLELKDQEDSLQGMVWPTTHNHVQPISVGGVQLARVVELINGYTVTFEDGMYAVNLVGANTNLQDVTNVNQVSIRAGNTAGLVLVETGVSGLTPTESAALVLAAALMQADQFFDKDTGLLHYYARGTTTDLIPPKTVAGEQVADDVSIQE